MEKHQILRPKSLQGTPMNTAWRYITAGTVAFGLGCFLLFDHFRGEHMDNRIKVGDAVDYERHRYRRALMSRYAMVDIRPSEIVKEANKLKQVEDVIQSTELPPSGV